VLPRHRDVRPAEDARGVDPDGHLAAHGTLPLLSAVDVDRRVGAVKVDEDLEEVALRVV